MVEQVTVNHFVGGSSPSSGAMRKDRNKFELWLDRHNHTMELMRTVVAFVVLIMQIIILIKIAG